MTKQRYSILLAASVAVLPALSSAAEHSLSQQFSAYHTLQSRRGQDGQLEVVARTASLQQTMGYTDQPVPADIEMPENMQKWLECVDQAAQFVNDNPQYSLGTASASSVVISPILGPIMWNQSYPYNNFCPSGTPVGCVATAMAQVLYYYRYPEHGFLSKSYTQGSYTLSADFENTYYQWDKMFDIFDGTSTDEQNRAVAELSYHCGVAVNMSYAPNGSGAWLERVPHALHKYFGYNSKACVRNRSNFTYEDWSSMLVAELEAGRPILFAGNSADVGHCFVIDGINAAGLFHVNWGWGGYYNGYFDIGILNPYGTGIGGSQSDEFGYCFSQGAVFQLCPEEGVGVDLCPISCETYGYWYTSSTGFSVGYTFQNNSGDAFHATVGIELFDEQGNILRLPGVEYDFGAYPNRGYWQWNEFHVSTADSLPDGSYSYGCYCLIPSLDSTYFHLDSTPAIPLATFDIENGVFVNYSHTTNAFRLTASNVNFVPGQVLAVGKIYDCSFEVTNLSQSTFVGMASPVFVTFTDGGNVDTKYEFGSNDLKILPGETVEVTVPVWVNEANNWYFAVLLQDYGYGRTLEVDFEGLETIASEFTSESPAALTLVDGPQLLTERCEVDGDIAFEMTVDNLGGNFSSNIAMMFFANKNATENPSLVIEATQNLPMTTPGNTITIPGKLTGLKGMTKYFARPFYQDQRGEYLQLLPASGKLTPIEVKVYNSTGIDEIRADEDDEAPAYDLMGRRIQGQSHGLRIQNHAASLR